MPFHKRSRPENKEGARETESKRIQWIMKAGVILAKEKVLPATSTTQEKSTGEQREEILNTTNATALSSDEASDKSATTPEGQHDDSSPLTSDEIEEAEKIEAENKFAARRKTVERWEGIVEHVNDLCIKCRSKEQAERLVEYFATIPYVTEDMKAQVRSLFKEWFSDKTESGLEVEEGIQQVSAVEGATSEEESLESLVALLPAEKREFLLNQPNRQMALEFARDYVEVRRKTREAESKCADFQSKLTEKDCASEFALLAKKEWKPILMKWSKKLRQIESTLHQLAGFSQAETIDGSVGSETESKLARQAVGD